jgi:hypothetical protein
MRNGYYFDKAKGRFRISISTTVNGNKIRKSRLLPKSINQADAEALADAMRVAITLEAAGLKPQQRWEDEVLRAYVTQGSWLHQLFSRARERGKKKGVGCSLSLDDLRDMCLRSHGRCELSGIVFSTIRAGQAKMRPFVVSLDRKNPQLGYARDNCRLVCACINIALFTWGEEIFDTIAVGYVLNRFLAPYTGLIQRINLAKSLSPVDSSFSTK